jgi:hypothetical protein
MIIVTLNTAMFAGGIPQTAKPVAVGGEQIF